MKGLVETFQALDREVATVVTSEMALKVFESKVAVFDRLIQEVQELADLYVRLLEISGDEPASVVNEHVGQVLEAFAKTYLGYRHAVTAVSQEVGLRGGLEVHATWDF